MKYNFNLKVYLVGIITLIVFSGCSTMRNAAVKQIGSTLSSKNTMLVITSDNDPELIWDSMPFALKTMEVMLAQDPSNANLQLALANGYIQYAYGDLAQQAQMIEYSDYSRSKHLWYRTYNLSLRGRDYALSVLDSKYPGFSKNVRTDTKTTLAKMTAEDVPALYWAAAGWMGAIVANKSDMENMAEMPVAVAMMSRAMELNEYYNDGAIHEFFIAYEAKQPNSNKESMEKARMHFDKVVAYTNGKKAYPYVIFAESIAVKKQDLALFNEMLDKALAVDPNEVKEWRLNNTIAQERAAWLKTQIPRLFADYEEVKE